MARILIAGCGDVGGALGAELAGAGHAVWGLRRRVERLPAAVRPIAADLARPGDLRDLPVSLDAVVYTAAADAHDEPAYRAAYVDGLRNLLEALGPTGLPRRLVYASSTAVYEQQGGEWVDEDSPVGGAGFAARALLDGEALVGACIAEPVVVRFAGIYGPGRTQLFERVRRGESTVPPGGPRYANRIHRDDCVGVLRHLLALAHPQPLYVAVDHEPAPLDVVLRWLAREMDAPPPRVAPADVSGRRAHTNKRCRNARLLASGYRFRVPTYREGYRPLLDRPA